MSAGEGARTYTFLYTDIVGSSRLWEANPHAMASAIEAHNLLIEAIVEEHRGQVFKSLGDGLACVFESADSAVRSGVAIQRALASADLACPISVRVGIHSGTAHAVGRDFGGPVLNRVSRITDLAEGGQVIVSEAARSLALDYLGDSIEFEALGIIQLEGMARPESVYGILAEGLASTISLVTQTELPPSNIEPLHHPFVGRAAERRNLVDRLKSDEQRFITVVGFGGIGKTTLARQCGLDVLESFGNQVYWIECETLRTREDLHTAILEVLDQGNDGSDAEGVLIEAIGDKRALIICDCFENMVTVGGTLERLIRRCTRLKVLVTSRIVLGSEAEHLVELKGLGSKRQGSMESDAVELLFSQARRHSPTFGLANRERALARKLVGQVEYVPLAIVICAGRLRHTPLEALHDQIRKSLLSTVRSIRDPAGRHSGLARVIQMSFDLLEAADQRVLQGLAIFEGGFTIEAVSAVLGPELPKVEENLYRLRDNSLVSIGDGSRLRLLDSVREFLLERRPLPSSAQLSSFSGYFQRVAEEIGRQFENDECQRATRKWREESANIRRAIDRELDAQNLLSFARSLSRILLETGSYEELDSLLSRAIPAARDDFQTFRKLSAIRAIANRRCGNPKLSAAIFEALAEKARELEDWDTYADALCDEVVALIDCSDLERAATIVQQVRQLGALAGTNAFSAIALQAQIDSMTGLMDAAIAACRGLLAAEGEFPNALLYLGRSIGETFRNCGALDESRAVLTSSLSQAMTANFPSVCASLLLELAETARLAGNEIEASLCLDALLAMPRSATQHLQRRIAPFTKALGHRATPATTLRNGTWRESAECVHSALSRSTYPPNVGAT